MKTPLFSILLMAFIISLKVQAQQKKIYSESFPTNGQTTAIINLNNASVTILPSNDDQFHIDYSATFENYTKEDIEDYLKGLRVQATHFRNNINVITSGEKSLSAISYTAPSGIMVKIQKGAEKEKRTPFVTKAKAAIIAEINELNNKDFKSEALHRLKFQTIDGEEVKDIDDYIQTVISHFVIKVPENVRLSVNGKDAKVVFKENIKNELNINLKRGGLIAKTLANQYNMIKIENADLRILHINGGNYALKNVAEGLVGSINDTEMNVEFSEIAIGEIQQGVTVKDFNGTLWLYNYAKDFKRFDLFCEYSKIHFYYPKDDHGLKVFGNNTMINHPNNFKIKMQQNSSGEKFFMMQRKAKGVGHFSGDINADIIHSIIYSNDNSVVKINN